MSRLPLGDMVPQGVLETMLVTSPCPGMVWARVGSEATDPEALSSPSLPPVSLVTSLASS